MPLDEQKLNTKLAKWSGFKWEDNYWGDCWCEYPDGTKHHFHPESSYDNSGYSAPNFTQSLDACFKWLPFPFDTLWIVRNPDKTQYCWGYARGEVNDVVCWSKELPIEKCLSPLADHQALALCLAIEKLIDAGVH